MEKLTQIPTRIRVAAAIRKAILTGEFVSGQEVTLSDMARRLGVSRTPVREAFQMLETDGLISLRMNRGAIVNTIDEKFIVDHYETRMLLEGEAAYRAALHGMDVEMLRSVCKEMRDKLRNGNDSEYVESNQQIHTQIWQAADNQRLYAILMSLWNGPSVGKAVNVFDHQYLSTIEHTEIIDYIGRQDAERARRAMMRHIERSMDNILRSFHAQ